MPDQTVRKRGPVSHLGKYAAHRIDQNRMHGYSLGAAPVSGVSAVPASVPAVSSLSGIWASSPLSIRAKTGPLRFMAETVDDLGGLNSKINILCILPEMAEPARTGMLVLSMHACCAVKEGLVHTPDDVLKSPAVLYAF